MRPSFAGSSRRLLVRLAHVVLAATTLASLACKRQVAGGSTDGAAVFAEACARCHGPGGKPPPQMVDSLGVRDLTAPDFRARRDRATIENQVRRGSANGRMPAFTGALSEPQVQAVAAYVLTLGE